MGLAGRSIVQVALTSADLVESKRFYTEVLELDLLFETNGMVFYQAGGVRLMVGKEGGGSANGGSGPAIYFDAPDLPSLSEELEGRGVSFLGPAEVVQRTAQGDLQLRFFRDPDGNLLSLMGVVRT